jgi:hypothetical protein
MSGTRKRKLGLASVAVSALAITAVFNSDSGNFQTKDKDLEDGLDVTAANIDEMSQEGLQLSLTEDALSNDNNEPTTEEADMAEGDQAAANNNAAKLSAEILQTLRDLEKYYYGPSGSAPIKASPEDGEKKKEFINYLEDQKAIDALDKVKSLLASGADPNYVDPVSGESAFAWSLWIAHEFDRPDVIDEFLKFGADPKQKVSISAPMPASQSVFKRAIFGRGGPKQTEISIVDHALIALWEAQQGYRRHMNTAATILKSLNDAGATLDDAIVMKSPSLKEYKDTGMHIVGMEALRDAGLVSEFDVSEFASKIEGHIKVSRIANSLTTINEAFFKANNGRLIDYPDAIPGGPEPYKIMPGDTLWNIATRYKNAMGSNTVQEAVEAIATNNNIPLDSNNNPGRVLNVGETILLPVPVDNMIGTMGASAAHSIYGVANRMKASMGIDDTQEAFEKLVKANNITVGGIFSNLRVKSAPGSNLKVPMQDGSFSSAVVQFDDLLRGMAVLGADTFYLQNATEEEAMEELARLNGTSLSDIRSGKDVITPGQPVVSVYFNDSYSHMEKLTPPADYDATREVNLIIVEPEDYHGKQTLRTAASTNYAINPDVDFSRFYRLAASFVTDYPHADSDAFSILLNLDKSDLQDQVIFSYSMGVRFKEPRLNDMRNYTFYDNIEHEDILSHMDELEKNKPIIFDAAGNEHPQMGPYAPSYLTIHSPRTVIVGAAGMYPVEGMAPKLMISPYSSYGAEICAPLSTEMGKQLEGTSFSTPLLAGIYRQFSEWYGDALTFEEIMAVGMMTASQDILDFDPQYGVGSVSASGEEPDPVQAKFRTNGSGLPVHSRCGAGVIDQVAWNDTWKKMSEFKQTIGADAEFYSIGVDFKDPAEIITSANGDETEYVYHVKVTEDMTLGRLTFMPSQKINERSDVVVETPSGFKARLPRARTDIVSTSSFNYEDVKQGDIIKIRTNKPFADNAGMVLRGHADGNVIQATRDYLRSNGNLPEPLKLIEGDNIFDDSNEISIDPEKEKPPVDIDQKKFRGFILEPK